jgi:hypothetical protein
MIISAIALTVVCAASLSTGCATVSPIHDYCQIAKPILLAKGEAAKLSDATDREILAHNETYAKICK